MQIDDLLNKNSATTAGTAKRMTTRLQSRLLQLGTEQIQKEKKSKQSMLPVRPNQITIGQSTRLTSEWKQQLFFADKSSSVSATTTSQNDIGHADQEIVMSQDNDDTTSLSFSHVPFTKHMEFYIPQVSERTTDDFYHLMNIIELLPTFLQEKIGYQRMVKLYKRHCKNVPNEAHRTLVMIDGGKFEFYVKDPNRDLDEDEDDECEFDDIVMDPFLTEWNLGYETSYYESAQFFRVGLYQYIREVYKKDQPQQNYNIHSVSLLVDFPGCSQVHQWSHIDGEETFFQGSVLCGNGTTVAMTIFH
jgi:hypothetical protein